MPTQNNKINYLAGITKLAVTYEERNCLSGSPWYSKTSHAAPYFRHIDPPIPARMLCLLLNIHA